MTPYFHLLSPEVIAKTHEICHKLEVGHVYRLSAAIDYTEVKKNISLGNVSDWALLIRHRNYARAIEKQAKADTKELLALQEKIESDLSLHLGDFVASEEAQLIVDRIFEFVADAVTRFSLTGLRSPRNDMYDEQRPPLC